jgi:hypothetical protein
MTRIQRINADNTRFNSNCELRFAPFACISLRALRENITVKTDKRI